MKDWLEELASALGVEPLAREESGAILKLAREVAHGAERRFAPLSTYLLGVAVGAGTAAGSDRAGAFREALAGARRAVPPADGDATPGPRDG